MVAAIIILIPILSTLVVGCNLSSKGDDTALINERTQADNNQLINQLTALIPESATSSIIIEAGKVAVISDSAQKINIEFPANSFTEFALATIEPITQVDEETLSYAASFTSLTANAYKNPTFVHGFKLTVQNSSQSIGAALDFTICHNFADYNPSSHFIAVSKDGNGERINAALSLKEGTQSELCFASNKSNAEYFFIQLEVLAIETDLSPPANLEIDFSLLANDLIDGTAEINLLAIDDATKIAFTQGTLCDAGAAWEDIDLTTLKHSITGISLTGEIEENISISVQMQDSSQNISECITHTKTFINTIAQKQKKEPFINEQKDTTPPTPPTSFTHPEYSYAQSFNVTWEKSAESDVASYLIKMCPEGQTCRACTETSQAVEASAAPSATVSNLTANIELFVCVQAVDQAGNLSEWGRSNQSSIYLANDMSSYIKRFGAHFKNDTVNALGYQGGFKIIKDEKHRALYIVGQTIGNFAPGSNYLGDGTFDLFVVRTTYEGEYLWAKQLNNLSGFGTNGNHEDTGGATVDKNGDLIVAGFTKDHLTTTPNGENGINTDLNNDPFFVHFGRDRGDVITLTQKHQTGNYYVSDIEPDGNDGFYVAIMFEKELVITNETVNDEYPDAGTYSEFYFSTRHLDKNLNYKSDGLVSPWIRIGDNAEGKEKVSLKVDANNEIIVGLTTPANKPLEFCQGESITNNPETQEREKTATTSTECTSRSGTWMTDAQTQGSTGQKRDAAILKISTSAENRGEIIKSYRFGSGYSASGPKRDSSGDETIFQIALQPQTNAIFLQGSTNGNLAETNGNSFDNGDADMNIDIFVARLSSNLDLEWVRHFGSETIPAGPVDPGNNNVNGNVAGEHSRGALFWTQRGRVITSFGSLSDYLQQEPPGNTSFSLFSIFVALDENTGEVIWKKQYGKLDELFYVTSMDGDVYGNSFFTGQTFSPTESTLIEAPAQASGSDADEITDLFYGVMDPDGALTIPIAGP